MPLPRARGGEYRRGREFPSRGRAGRCASPPQHLRRQAYTILRAIDLCGPCFLPQDWPIRAGHNSPSGQRNPRSCLQWNEFSRLHPRSFAALHPSKDLSGTAFKPFMPVYLFIIGNGGGNENEEVSVTTGYGHASVWKQRLPRSSVKRHQPASGPACRPCESRWRHCNRPSGKCLGGR